MADLATDIKSDIEAGTPTNYTEETVSVYIAGGKETPGGPQYILLKNARRPEIEQTISGSILYEKRSCSVEVVAPTATIREQIYDDICDILIATTRGYKLERASDLFPYGAQDRTILEVSTIA